MLLSIFTRHITVHSSIIEDRFDGITQLHCVLQPEEIETGTEREGDTERDIETEWLMKTGRS